MLCNRYSPVDYDNWGKTRGRPKDRPEEKLRNARLRKDKAPKRRAEHVASQGGSWRHRMGKNIVWTAAGRADIRDTLIKLMAKMGYADATQKQHEAFWQEHVNVYAQVEIPH